MEEMLHRDKITEDRVTIL